MIEFTMHIRIVSEILSLEDIESFAGQTSSGYYINILDRNCKTRPFTLWVYTIEEAGSNLEDLIDLGLNIIDTALNSGLEQSKCKININCSCISDNGQGGIDLGCSTLEKLAARKLSIGFML